MGPFSAHTILEMFENNNQAGRDLRVPRAAGADLTVPSVDISGLTQSPVMTGIPVCRPYASSIRDVASDSNPLPASQRLSTTSSAACTRYMA